MEESWENLDFNIITTLTWPCLYVLWALFGQARFTCRNFYQQRRLQSLELEHLILLSFSRKATIVPPTFIMHTVTTLMLIDLLQMHNKSSHFAQRTISAYCNAHFSHHYLWSIELIFEVDTRLAPMKRGVHFPLQTLSMAPPRIRHGPVLHCITAPPRMRERN